MPCSFFGVSPPIRNGWAGGAANPLAHDKTWDKSAYNASHVNLQVSLIMSQSLDQLWSKFKFPLISLQALREIESNGASFLRGDLLMPGSTPPDARMAFDQRAHAPSPAAPIQAPAAAPMIIDPLFTTTTVPCYHSSFQTSNLANNKSNEVGETKPFSCQTHYFLN